MNQFLWRAWFKVKRWFDMREQTPWYPPSKKHNSNGEKK